jgi:predicted transcriptional regulator
VVASLVSTRLSDNSGGFGNVRSLEDMCKHCTPITPVQCISLCRFYKVKNELRNLRNIMNNPCYVADFFNALKNQTRLHIFRIIINRRCTLSKIQQELGKVSIKQSQNAISEDHIQPLITVGLISESLGKYHVTLFGTCVHELLYGFDGFLQKLPPQSKCYEETLIQALFLGPKTYEEINCLLSSTVVSRIIKRLTDTGLVNIPASRSYIFFYKSKRNPDLEKLTSAEMTTYQTIPIDGIDVNKLAKLAGLSQRRTYAHIRRLKGKKLVYAKNIPLTYSLTANGQKLATILHNLTQKIVETWNFTQHITPTPTAQQTNPFYLSSTHYIDRR